MSQKLNDDGHLFIKSKNNTNINLNLIGTKLPKEIQDKPVPNNFFNQYEVMLPVLFIILFLIIMFLIYAIKNNGLKGVLRMIFCCVYTDNRKKTHPYSLIYPLRATTNPPFHMTQHQLNPQLQFQQHQQQEPQEIVRSNYVLRKSLNSMRNNYYEDTNSGFYRIQRDAFNNYYHPRMNFNNNYDQLYSTHPNNMIMTLNGHIKVNKLYQSEDTTGYELPSFNVDGSGGVGINVDGPELDQNHNRIDFNNPINANNHFVTSNLHHMNTSQAINKSLLKEKLTNKNLNREAVALDTYDGKQNKTSRKSYSNSKLDYQKWERNLSKSKQSFNHSEWRSRLLTEHEMKRFLNFQDLNNKNIAKHKMFKGNYSERTLRTNFPLKADHAGPHEPKHQVVNNHVYKQYNYFLKSNDSNVNFSSQSFTEEKFLNKDVYHLNDHQVNLIANQINSEFNLNQSGIPSISAAGGKKEIILMSKSSSGLLMSSNKETFSIALSSNNDLDLDRNNLKISSMNQLKKEMDQTKINMTPNELPSLVLNCSEINSSDKKNYKIPKSQLRHRSSTFKALNLLNKSNKEKTTLVKLGQKFKNFSSENMIKSICKDLKENNSLFSIFSLNKLQTKNGYKYSRMCKSFTFVSHKFSDNIQVKKEPTNTKQLTNEANTIKTAQSVTQNMAQELKVSSSEPNKLSNVANNQTGSTTYMKNANDFDSNDFISMNSLNEKQGTLSTWKPIRLDMSIQETSTDKTKALQKGKSIDAAIQTSLITSDTSSFNSHATTLLHTNTFGSIMANFGSVTINPSSVNNVHKKLGRTRHRAYSDGNVLSNEPNTDSVNTRNTKEAPSIVHSASSSKLSNFPKPFNI